MGKYLDLPNDTPSHDRFQRFFENIDKDGLRDCLFSASLSDKLDLGSEILAINRKKLRGASLGSRGNDGLCILTVWTCEEEVSEGEVRADGKSNEIEREADYILALKITKNSSWRKLGIHFPMQGF